MFCVALCGVLWMFDGKQKIGSVPRAGFLLMDAFYDISYNWFRYSKCFILFVFCSSTNFLYIRNFIHDSLVVQTEENRTKNLGKMKKFYCLKVYACILFWKLQAMDPVTVACDQMYTDLSIFHVHLLYVFFRFQPTYWKFY